MLITPVMPHTAVIPRIWITARNRASSDCQPPGGRDRKKLTGTEPVIDFRRSFCHPCSNWLCRCRRGQISQRKTAATHDPLFCHNLSTLRIPISPKPENPFGEYISCKVNILKPEEFAASAVRADAAGKTELFMCKTTGFTSCNLREIFCQTASEFRMPRSWPRGFKIRSDRSDAERSGTGCQLARVWLLTVILGSSVNDAGVDGKLIAGHPPALPGRGISRQRSRIRIYRGHGCYLCPFRGIADALRR